MRRWYRFLVLKVDMAVGCERPISSYAHNGDRDASLKLVTVDVPMESRFVLQVHPLLLHAYTRKTTLVCVHSCDPTLRGDYINLVLDIVNRYIRTRDNRLDDAFSVLALPHARDSERGGGIFKCEPR